MARLTLFSSSTPAGAMHTPIQPVIKKSLKPIRLSFSWSFFCFSLPTQIPPFLCILLVFGVIVPLSISISDMGIWGVTACLAVEVLGVRWCGGVDSVTWWGVDGGCQEEELLWDKTIVGSWHLWRLAHVDVKWLKWLKKKVKTVLWHYSYWNVMHEQCLVKQSKYTLQRSKKYDGRWDQNTHLHIHIAIYVCTYCTVRVLFTWEKRKGKNDITEWITG